VKPTLDTCAYCPRLCRHVCPVAVATARESATPTAMASMARLHRLGKIDTVTALAGTALCSGCGACERHCYHQVPFPSLLRRFRAELGVQPPEAPGIVLVPALPAELPRFRTCAEGADGADGALACCGHRDGFAEAQPEAARMMAEAVARHFAGQRFSCASPSCARWLAQHGAQVVAPTDNPSA